MSDPFLGEIKLVAFNYAPRGWLECTGQLLPIAQNTALFSLLGTQFGGNGVTTFGLRDLRGRAMAGQGQGPGLSSWVIGEQLGTNTESLSIAQTPAHTHPVQATSAVATGTNPQAGTFAKPNISARFQAMYHDTPN